MSYTITSKCISCHRCVSQCPTGAISWNGARYEINPNVCNDCAGYYGVPQCAAVCPTNDACQAIAPADYWDSWFVTYGKLVSQMSEAQQGNYWLKWFELYSERLSQQLQAEICNV